jgi:hypothetical protein
MAESETFLTAADRDRYIQVDITDWVGADRAVPSGVMPRDSYRQVAERKVRGHLP